MVSAFCQQHFGVQWKKRRSEQGFITLATIFGLPIILVLAIVFYFQSSILQVNENLRNRCRVELLHLQDDLAHNARDIFALNAKVRLLKVQRAAAESALSIASASGNPAAIATALHALHAVKSSQKALCAQQASMIQNAQRKMQLAPSSVLKKIQSDSEKSKRKLQAWLKLDWRERSPKNGRFAIRKISPDEEYPEYEPQDNPEEKQAVHVSWMSTWTSDFKSRFFKKISLRREEECGATWRVRIKSSNQFSPGTSSSGNDFGMLHLSRRDNFHFRFSHTFECENTENLLRTRRQLCRFSMKKCKLLFQDKIYLGSFCGLLLLIAVLFIANLKPHAEAAIHSESPDTFIPEGYILVPIELQNADNFDGLIDSYAVVDLFELIDPTRKKQKKVASRVQMIRAPLNHERFAILIAEKDSSSLLSAQGSLRAVIKNPTEPGRLEPGIVYTKGGIE